MKKFHELRRPVALFSLAIVLLFASAGMTSGQESFIQLDISGATLEGKYFLGAVKGPDAVLLHPGLQVYRANIEEGDLRITTRLNPNTEFAKYQENRTLNIEVGPNVATAGFAAIPLGGDLFASGPVSQDPKIDATFRWNSSEMYYAIFPIRTGNIVTPASGPHFLKTEVLILPKDVSMRVSGIYGRNKADPTLKYSPDYPGGNNITGIHVSGLSPFAEWVSIELDGKPLVKAQWRPDPEFGFYQDPPPLPPAPGTWIRKDPIAPDDPTYLPLSSDVGYLFTDTGEFLGSYYDSDNQIGLPEDIKTGLHEITLTTKPYPLIGPSVHGFNILGITGTEGRVLTAKFLLFGPKFTLSQQQVAPGETLFLNGSGFAPDSRVKIFAQVETSGRDIPAGEIRPWIKPPANLPAEPSSKEIREVEIGAAATDSTGSFSQEVQIPASDSDFFRDIWKVFTTVPARGSINVKIDDLIFQSRYSSSYVPEIVDGVTERITYTPPGVITPPSPGVTARLSGNITAVPGAVPTAPGPVTGISPGPTAPLAGAVQPGMENDIDRPGNDYRNFDLSSPDPALCKQACDDDLNCKAFTYVKPGFQGSSARCWLKNAIPSAVPSSCCISGVKEEVNVTDMQLLDHAMASSVDESTNDVITRTNAFSTTDSKAYSWLSLGNARAGTVEWKWYSPDGALYHTGSFDIPEPSGAYWDAYNLWYYITIAGNNAANLPGNWHVDVYLDGRKLLTEQFTIGDSGISGAIPAKPFTGVPKTLRGCEAYDTEICGTWTLGGDHFNANWDTGDTGTVRIERWDTGGVVLTRYETEGISAGLSARYEGQISGNRIEDGVVTWTLGADTWSGTWSAEWTEAAGPSISAFPSTVNPGETITVTYSGAPGFETDWIALYKAGDPNTSYGEYYYLQKQKSGTLTFTAPTAPGEYDFRLFENWPDGGYNDLARSNTVRIAG